MTIDPRVVEVILERGEEDFILETITLAINQFKLQIKSLGETIEKEETRYKEWTDAFNQAKTRRAQ